jgi:L-lactate dehydrogenase complex protein LldG
MSGARDTIFGAMRARLGRGPLDGAARAALDARLAAHAAGVVPASAAGDRETLIAHFTEKARAVTAGVTRLGAKADLPEAIAAYLAEHNLPAELLVAPDPWLEGVPWDKAPLIEHRSGTPGIDDPVGVTLAAAGIAETGSLLVRATADNAHITSFLPETNIAVLPTDRLVGSLEQGWAALRALGPSMPRAVSLITGPSRTGDIEQRIELGAHGPRRLQIMLVDGEEA